MINKLPNNNLDLQATSVYDFNELTLQGLLSKFFSKINECVDVSNQALNFLIWLKEEGLPIEVQKEIEKMYLDGRLTEIINQLANDVKAQVQEIKSDLSNHKSEYEQFKTNTNITIEKHTNELKQIALNVRSFGAKGDGVTDDTQAFRNALSSGKTIYIPNGDYKITNTLYLSDKHHIIGEHFTTTLIIFDGANGGNAFEGGESTIYCVLENFKLVRSNRTKKGYGIFMNFVNNQYEYDSKHRFKNIWIDGFEKNFYISMSNRGCVYENCLSTNAVIGYEYSTDTTLSNCGASYCTSYGYRGYNNNQLINCKAFQCDGCYSVTGSNNLLNVHVQESRNGFYVVGENNIINANIDMMNVSNVTDSRVLTHDGSYNMFNFNVDNTNGNLTKIIHNNTGTKGNNININLKDDKNTLTKLSYPTEDYLKNNLIVFNGVSQNRGVWLKKAIGTVTVGTEYSLGIPTESKEVVLVPIVAMSNKGEKYININFPDRYITLFGQNGNGSWIANATITMTGDKFTVTNANNDSGEVTSLRVVAYYKI